jgi:hypothetical protein
MSKREEPEEFEEFNERTPEDYGFPETPTKQNKLTWVRQEAFLAVYSRTEKIGKSAK